VTLPVKVTVLCGLGRAGAIEVNRMETKASGSWADAVGGRRAAGTNNPEVRRIAANARSVRYPPFTGPSYKRR
jgi:hypothetical protein